MWGIREGPGSRTAARQTAAGIIDPTKVVRIDFEDAASIAGLLIPTEMMIARKAGKLTGSSDMEGMGDMM